MWDCSYRLDPDEDLSFSDSDDSGDDVQPQTSGKGGEIVVSDSDSPTFDAVVNSDEAASSDTCSDRKPDDGVDDDCKIAVETASK
jgi:hypothetical protein